MKKMTTLLFLAFAVAGKAQTGDTTSGKLNAFSTLGAGSVSNNYKPASGTSIQKSTGVELRLSRQSSLGASLSFDSYGYKKATEFYNLDGSLKATALALFYRYKFGTGTWQPYLKAGGGTAWLSLPTVTGEQNKTTIENKVQNVGVALAEIGLQVHVMSRYALLLGAERRWFATSSLADNAALGTTGFRVGLLSSF